MEEASGSTAQALSQHEEHTQAQISDLVRTNETYMTLLINRNNATADMIDQGLRVSHQRQYNVVRLMEQENLVTTSENMGTLLTVLSEESLSGASSSPTRLSLPANKPKGTLQITVSEGRGFSQQSDMKIYARIVLNTSLQARTSANTCVSGNIFWNELMEFEWDPDVQTNLAVSMFDSVKMIGCGNISIQSDLSLEDLEVPIVMDAGNLDAVGGHVLLYVQKEAPEPSRSLQVSNPRNTMEYDPRSRHALLQELMPLYSNAPAMCNEIRSRDAERKFCLDSCEDELKVLLNSRGPRANRVWQEPLEKGLEDLERLSSDWAMMETDKEYSKMEGDMYSTELQHDAALNKMQDILETINIRFAVVSQPLTYMTKAAEIQERARYSLEDARKEADVLKAGVASDTGKLQLRLNREESKVEKIEDARKAGLAILRNSLSLNNSEQEATWQKVNADILYLESLGKQRKMAIDAWAEKEENLCISKRHTVDTIDTIVTLMDALNGVDAYAAQLNATSHHRQAGIEALTNQIQSAAIEHQRLLNDTKRMEIDRYVDWLKRYFGSLGDLLEKKQRRLQEIERFQHELQHQMQAVESTLDSGGCIYSDLLARCREEGDQVKYKVEVLKHNAAKALLDLRLVDTLSNEDERQAHERAIMQAWNDANVGAVREQALSLEASIPTEARPPNYPSNGLLITQTCVSSSSPTGRVVSSPSSSTIGRRRRSSSSSSKRRPSSHQPPTQPSLTSGGSMSIPRPITSPNLHMLPPLWIPKPVSPPTSLQRQYSIPSPPPPMVQQYPSLRGSFSTPAPPLVPYSLSPPMTTSYGHMSPPMYSAVSPFQAHPIPTVSPSFSGNSPPKSM